MYEVVICFSYNVEAESKDEATRIAEEWFREETHPEPDWFNVIPIEEEV